MSPLRPQEGAVFRRSRGEQKERPNSALSTLGKEWRARRVAVCPQQAAVAKPTRGMASPFRVPQWVLLDQTIKRRVVPNTSTGSVSQAISRKAGRNDLAKSASFHPSWRFSSSSRRRRKGYQKKMLKVALRSRGAGEDCCSEPFLPSRHSKKGARRSRRKQSGSRPV